MDIGHQAVHAAIDRAKGGDPFAPVAVVPMSPGAGASLRRSLVRRGGAVNVQFLTLARIAETITGRVTSLTRGLRLSFVRRVAASALGEALLGTASSHPATLRALDARFRELRRCSPAALRAVTGLPVVELYNDFRSHAASFTDETDLLEAAASAVREGSWPSDAIGHVILQLAPSTVGISAHERVLVDAIVDARRGEMISPDDEVTTRGMPLATRVVLAPDAETEVRLAIGEVLRLSDAGVALDDMAIVHTGIEPYPRVIAELLDVARIPWGGSRPLTLSETVTGRTLLGLLGLPSARWSRVAVMHVLAGAPVVDDDTVRRWEADARRANIVAGAAQWRERLGQNSPLADYVEGLVLALQPPPLTWRALVDWALGLLPAFSDTYRDDVTDAVRALAGLDGQGEPPTVALFVDAVAAQLDVGCGQRPFGGGVSVGTARDLVGSELHTVVVLGMVEGSMPQGRSDDPLLPDDARARTGGALPTRRERRDAEYEALVGLLDLADERVLCAARADQRAQQKRLPSRWLLDAAPHTGRLSAKALDELAAQAHPSWLLSPPSVASVLLDRPGASVQEDTVQTLVASDAHDALGLARGFAAVRARRSAEITEWDGDVGEHAGLQLEHKLLSATTVEVWATCPFRYFLKSVLRVGETATPEERVAIDPRDRGVLVHDVLEAVVRRRIAAGLDVADFAHDKGELQRITSEVCDELERSGRAGRPLPWLLERRSLDSHLSAVLERDRDDADASKLSPIRAEVAFGDRESCELPAVAVTLDNGKRLRFGGRIDRIDASADRSEARVTDYKTGRSDAYRRDLSPKQKQTTVADPTAAGTRLQLPIYALAAAPDVAQGARLVAEYWFVTDVAQDYPRVEVVLDDATHARLRDVLGRIAGGIEAGAFAAIPGEAALDTWHNCRYCEFDRVCPADRGDAAARKQDHPTARRHAELRIEPA